MTDGRAGNSTKAGNDQALDHHLPDQLRRAGAERRSYRELALPGRRADEQQVRHVQAGDQQDQPRDTRASDLTRGIASETAFKGSGLA